MNDQKTKHLLRRNNEIDNDIKQPQVIDLDISHNCTRKCSFCPQSTYEMSGVMSLNYIIELQKQMIDNNFRNIVCMAGHGEPTCHPQFPKILEILNKTNCKHIEIISNGDNLINNKLDIEDILKYKKIKLTLSAYSKNHFDEMYTRFSNFDNIIIKKMYTKDDLFWSNRGVFDTDNPYIDNYCYLPFYKLELGINGNYNLCCQDWSGEMSTTISIAEISYITMWNTLFEIERNKQLKAGKRVNKICKKCNVNGTLIGEKIFKRWKIRYDETAIK